MACVLMDQLLGEVHEKPSSHSITIGSSPTDASVGLPEIQGTSPLKGKSEILLMTGSASPWSSITFTGGA